MTAGIGFIGPLSDHVEIPLLSSGGERRIAAPTSAAAPCMQKKTIAFKGELNLDPPSTRRSINVSSFTRGENSSQRPGSIRLLERSLFLTRQIDSPKL